MTTDAKAHPGGWQAFHGRSSADESKGANPATACTGTAGRTIAVDWGQGTPAGEKPFMAIPIPLKEVARARHRRAKGLPRPPSPPRSRGPAPECRGFRRRLGLQPAASADWRLPFARC